MAKRALALLLTLLCLAVKDTEAAVLQQTTINRIDLPAEMSVAVSLNIEGYLFDLEGLTSPHAQVDFVSTEGNINITTLANDQGVFYFRSVLAPIQTGDFCFLSYDIDGIANNPLCFSPPPLNTKTTISGIVLSPTLSIDKDIFRQNDLVEGRGRSFPNAQIQIFMFEEERSWWQELIDVIIPAAFAWKEDKDNSLFSLVFIRNHRDVSNNSNRQKGNCQSQIEKDQIIGTHFSNLVSNKLAVQEIIEKLKPNTTILKSNLSIKNGMTTEAKQTWPISAQISDNLLRRALTKLINTKNNIRKKLMSNPIPLFFPSTRVYAREGPKLEISSNERGVFSFNLPTQKSTRWRFFAGPRIDKDNYTAQSNILTFSALSWWQWFLLRLFRFLYDLFSSVFRFLLRWETLTILLIASIAFLLLKTNSSQATKRVER